MVQDRLERLRRDVGALRTNGERFRAEVLAYVADLNAEVEAYRRAPVGLSAREKETWQVRKAAVTALRAETATVLVALGWTKVDVADLLGLSRARVSQIVDEG